MKKLNTIVSLKILIAFVVLSFVSCSEANDEPEDTGKTIITQDFSVTMDENPENGQLIGTISGTTNQGSVSFTIIEQSPEGTFSIDASNGELKVAEKSIFNFEINQRITGTVKVANGTLFEISTVIININDLEEDRVYDGDVILTTQDEVVNFGNTGFTHITGMLSIGTSIYDDIVDLSPLLNIEKIDSFLHITNCSNLITTAGLRNISYIGGGISIDDNPVLEKIPDLNKLTLLEEVLYISGNPYLNDISGLDQLKEIKGNLTLYDCSIENLNDLANLNIIEGNLTIGNNFHITDLDGLSNLSVIGGNINISYNDYLSNIDGLSNLNATVTGLNINYNLYLENINGLQNIKFTDYIYISNNASLKDIESLNKTTNLLRLNITNNKSLVSLNGLNNLSVVGEMGVYIENNDQLTNLSGLEGITNIPGELSIKNNSLLRDFCILGDLITAGNFGTYTVLENFYNPTLQDIIDGNCSI